jgi:hypothetical protein
MCLYNVFLMFIALKYINTVLRRKSVHVLKYKNLTAYVLIVQVISTWGFTDTKNQTLGIV